MTRRYQAMPDAGCHLITCSTMWWYPVFISKDTCDVVIDSLAYCRENKGLCIFAYVIMPTHFHAIVSAEGSADIGSILRDLKRHTSTAVNGVFDSTGDRLALRVFSGAAKHGKGNVRWKLWQDEYHPVGITTGKVFIQKAEYIHAKPVRKGLVVEPGQWWYSSARAFQSGEQDPLAVDWIEFD